MRKFEIVREEFKKGLNNYNNFKLPKRATVKSSGYDFYNNLNENIIVNPKTSFMYWTDIKYVSDADQEFLLIIPRSSLGIKQNMFLKNTVGDIDIDYANNIKNDGNIGISIFNYGETPLIIPAGQAIAQGIIMNFNVVDNDIPVFKERIGGFGSTNEVK